jgi:Transglycosylase SLT domain
MKQRLYFPLFSSALFLGFSLVPTPSDPAIAEPRHPAVLHGVIEPRRHTGLPEGHILEERRRFLSTLPFGPAMAVAAERQDVDGLLLAAIVETESRFLPTVVSPRGAVGLMQVQPATGAMYGASDLENPYVNLDVGSRYLRGLLQDYEGDLELALAAYNAGPAAVSRYGGVPPFRETRAYVKKVLRRYEAHKQSLYPLPG